MIKIQRKVISCITMLITIVSLSSVVLAADVESASSPEKTATVLGYTYSYYSSIHGSGSEVWGYTNIMVDGKENVPVGYMGLNSNLYDDEGALVKTSGWQYNDKSAAGMSISGGKYYKEGTYYSKGQVKLYNGDGYNTYTAYATPNMAIKSYNLTQIDVNDNGQTYGSDMLTYYEEDIPDLILAIGINGVKGYIYSSQLYGESNSTSSSRLIPLYENDGITVIGAFEISVEEFEIYTE